MKVEALRRGFYGCALRREGSVFELTDASHFAPSWMTRVADDAPVRQVSAQDALDAIVASRYGTAVPDVVQANDTPLHTHEFDPFR